MSQTQTTRQPDLSPPTPVNVDSLVRMMDRPEVCVLDVRTSAEFDTIRIPGSHNVPLDRLGEHVGVLGSVDRPFVLVCRSGARATQAHRTLVAEGKGDLHVLKGGLDAWDAAGADTERGKGEAWALDRQVRLVAGSISLVGVLGSLVVPRAKWLAGGIAAGLTFSAVTDTCAMGNALARLPYNQSAGGDLSAAVAAIADGVTPQVPA